MKTARIAILTSGPLCRNPRVLKEARTLAGAGHTVTVVTIAQHARFETYDAELLRSAPFRKIALDRVSTRRAVRIASLFERALAWTLRRLRVQHPASLGPYHALRRLVVSQGADLIIVHTELPFCIGAALIAQGRAVCADFEDWHSRDLLPDAQSNRPLALLARVEKTLLQHARYSTTTSLAMARQLNAVYGGAPAVIIPNTFPLSPQPPPPPRGTPPAFFWFSQTVGPGRGLESFLAAWRLTHVPSRLVLLGDVADDYRNDLLTALPESHRTRVAFHPLVAPPDLPAVLSLHDIGLALEPSKPENKNLTASNKIFQYLDAGLAVLATPTAGQREVLARCPDAGLLDDLSDPAALAARLDALLGDPVQLAKMAAAARSAAEREFCWERTSPLLLAAVSSAVIS